MSEILPFLKALASAPGLSAHEGPVQALIREKWTPLVDAVSITRLGSLQGLKRGQGREPRPSIMVAAHADAVGLMVTRLDEGLLHVHGIGGLDARVLPGTPVAVHGKRDLPGVIAMPPPRTLPDERRQDVPAMQDLLVDVGLPASRVKQLVSVGDLVSFDTQPVDLSGGVVAGHSMDNRASVAALTVCLEELRNKRHEWDVRAVATTQEEITYAGAATSAFELRPDIAVVMDVTYAKGPGAEGWQTFPLTGGPTLGWGPNLHPFLYKRFEELAQRLHIPAAMELMPTDSGTEAEAVQVAREGIPTMAVSIPLRYMHTAVEVVSVKDMQRAGRLVAEFIGELERDFVATIVWDETDGG